jgi:leucyl aminopeptidase
MKIKIITGDIDQIKAGAIILGIFEGQTALTGQLASVDKALEGAISRLIREGGLKGKLSEITVFYTLGKLPAERVLIVGLGKQPEFTSDRIREVTATVCRYLRQRWIATAASVLFGFRNGGLTATGTAQSMTEGALLGTYTFRHHKTEPPEQGEIKELTLVAPGEASTAAAGEGYTRGKILADAAILCRDMVNEPSNFKNPTYMAQRATEIARDYGLSINVLNREEMLALGMGGLLGVSQGSVQPPKFIVMHYRGRTEQPEVDLAIVGKGITFDSGGISIKPSEKMGEMKMDMSGGAAAMAAISAIAQLKPKLNVTALIPATENMPSGNAFHPGDVLTAMNGKTMEIITTDAEGRLILADALSYAVTVKAKNIVDISTLTGACIVALGDYTTGAFSNNDAFVNQVLKAGDESGEPSWRMPMGPKYRELIRSDVADIKNSGGRPAGAITAAEFLKEFVGNTPWVHLDVAGTAWADKEQGYLAKGATGVPVRTLVNLALAMAKE